jgi:hypothetical protein
MSLNEIHIFLLRPDDPVEYLAAYLMKHNPKNKK